jgi:hypothetical protein
VAGAPSAPSRSWLTTPDDVVTLVAHEPPPIPVLPDAAAAERVARRVLAQPAPDPVAFGMPTEDDGSRDSPLLSDRSCAINSYRPDVDAVAAAPTAS